MGKKKKTLKASSITYGVCHCGCDQIPTGKKALFVSGHDGKLRHLLVQIQTTGKGEVPEIAKEILSTFYHGLYRNVA